MSSNSDISGPVHLQDGASPFLFLALAHTGLTCPLQLGSLTSLYRVELQGAAFSCDPTNSSQWQLPPNVSYVDMSGLNLKPFDLLIPSSVRILRAANASIKSFSIIAPSPTGSPQQQQQAKLESLMLDSNDLSLLSASSGAASGTGENLFTALAALNFAPALRSLSCRSCGLKGGLDDVLQSLVNNPLLEEVLFSSNAFYSSIPTAWFSPFQYSDFTQTQTLYPSQWPRTIQALDFSHNPLIGGRLPTVSTGYTALQKMDWSDTKYFQERFQPLLQILSH